MRFFPLLTTSAFLLLAGAITAHAQGLVGIQNYSGDLTEDSPLQFSATARGGYDNLEYDNPLPGQENFESYYGQVGLGLTYTDADQVTPWSVALDLGAIHYFDSIPRYDDTFYNARLSFNIVHQINQRLKISDNFYLSYEAQPNLALGGTTTLFNGQYLYGFNNFNVSYAWSQRFSTTTSYTVDGIAYEDGEVSAAEDRLSHLIAQQFSYAVTRNTSVVGEYRYRHTTYRNSDGRDFGSHFVLAGIDQAWSQRFTGSFRAGAEFFSSDRTSSTAPYAEVALNYAVARRTQARWFGSLGYDAAELGNFSSRYSVRTGATLNHQFTKRFGANAGLQYVYSDFDSNTAGTDSLTEHSMLLSAGLRYQVLENLSVDANYNYSILNSDDDTRNFQRNNVSLGVTASF
jgi:Putative beta-barrel porin 2